MTSVIVKTIVAFSIQFSIAIVTAPSYTRSVHGTARLDLVDVENTNII